MASRKEKAWRTPFCLHSCAEVTGHPAQCAGKLAEGKDRKPAPAPTSLGEPQRHSPGRVGGRNEEIDDHAVRHVQTMLYRPAAEKAGYGGPTWTDGL